MFLNYGDVNFFEYGVLVDSQSTPEEVKILYCQPFIKDEVQYFIFSECCVDTNDSWIDKTAVIDFCGLSPDDDFIKFAIACIEYYGCYEFDGSYSAPTYTAEEVLEILKNYNIEGGVRYEYEA